MIRHYYILPPDMFRTERKDEDRVQEEKPVYRKDPPAGEEKDTANKTGTGRGHSSIKNLIAFHTGMQHRNPSGVKLEDLPADPFTKEEFMHVWIEYVEKLKSQGNKILSSFMEMQSPEINGNIVYLIFSGKLMAEEIKKHKGEILGYIHKKLNNYSIDFHLEVREDQRDESPARNLYTPGEKFAYLYTVNPLVKDLKERFSLHVT